MARHDETTPPITLGEQTKVRLPFLMLLALCATVATASIAWTNLRGASEDHTARLAAHEDRLAKIEANQADFAIVKNDVNWIRRTLEQQQRERRTSP